ncbi:MAG: HlyD family efflux transporter periplasmic adaptor subunit, partial [Gammaproteobacteria bacterium]|nr:HlyD family efflux transporter periplasmic adaptor subunit [Gammaproteobacteria bacterium]
AAELDLSRTSVRAPFDARILETRLDVGQVVGIGVEVGTMFSIDSLEIVVPVSAEERRRIGPVDGQRVSIRAPAATGDSLEGKLVRVSASLDERTRLGTLYIATNSPESLTLGEFVTVEIGGIDSPESYRLPAAALTSRDQLWVVDDGRLARRSVEVLGREAELVVVSAFDQADGIVAVPPANARDGLEVGTRTASELASAGAAADGQD